MESSWPGDLYPGRDTHKHHNLIPILRQVRHLRASQTGRNLHFSFLFPALKQLVTVIEQY